MFYLVQLISTILVYPEFPIDNELNEVEISDLNRSNKIIMQILNFNFTLMKSDNSPVYSFNGTDFTNIDNDDCYFTSFETSGSFYLCNGVSGTFTSKNGTAYKIEPLYTSEVGIAEITKEHELFTMDSLSGSYCGSKETDFDTNPFGIHKRNLDATTSLASRIVDTVLYLDFSFYQDRGANSVTDAQKFVNGANNLYLRNDFTTPLYLNITAIILLTSDLFILETDPNSVNKFLNLFYEYTVELSDKYPSISYISDPDISFLLSHRQTLPTSTVGLAYLGGACNKLKTYNVGLATRLDTRLDSWISLVIAHEIGHLLGASHDGNNNNCGKSGNIMSAIVESGNPIAVNQFSSCSKSYINKFITSEGSECLLAQSTASNQTCGNLFVDPGEEYL
eukprot:NODE_16_length_41655_cov_0.272813.p7 type:complete len:393 gc:universal NODE_16_length_41655_cov_0.272813:28580-29758(+)